MQQILKTFAPGAIVQFDDSSFDAFGIVILTAPIHKYVKIFWFESGRADYSSSEFIELACV
jgi:hypothetical protein